MAETIKIIFNTIGWATFVMGIVANLNNWVSLVLAMLGCVFIVIRGLIQWEMYRIKRIERMEKEDGYRSSRSG